MRKYLLKPLSLTLLLSFTFQLIFPLRALALTTGPSQPEVQSFEPVGTTEMVDLFSGDFVYNIPLMDIDGYPINISYHSGVTQEDEGSWVGLGWSLNPGEINRTVRGLPDDYNGDLIENKLQINPEYNYMGKVGIEVGAEVFGLDLSKLGINLGLNLSLYMNSNNYKGLSSGVRAGISAGFGLPSSGNMGNCIGLNPSIGVGSQSGVDLDASLSFSLSQKMQEDPNQSAFMSVGVGSGMNSRVGLKSASFSYSMGTSSSKRLEKSTASVSHSSGGSVSIPIGIQNYVPVITNATKVQSMYVQLKLGLEICGLYPTFLAGLGINRMAYEENGSRQAYGYNYLENAPGDRTGILDFIRDKDGVYNKSIRNLPISSLAYDIYSVSGQGTGGIFRPFRNDIATVYDPYVTSSSESVNGSIELGFAPNFFEIGGNVSTYSNEVTTGPWITTDFQGEQNGTLYEKLFYKQAGELTYNNQLGTNVSPNNLIFNDPSPLSLNTVYSGDVYSKLSSAALSFFGAGNGSSLGGNLNYAAMTDKRTARANLITPLTAEKASLDAVTAASTIETNESAAPNVPRVGGTAGKDQLSHISQLLPDGRRYIYGIPARTNCSRDVTFGSSGSTATQFSGGLIDATVPENNSGCPVPEKYYSSSIKPGYAHAFLLTDVLSPDYVDITGNGCSDDDLGGFVKFHYERKSKDYRWRAPASDQTGSGTVKKAHFDPGYQSDKNDGKATVSMGSREQWYVKTIESKNLVAEFITSARSDAKGQPENINTAYTGTTVSGSQNSWRLDEIRLYNKSQYYNDPSTAVPIKTVIFKYDYSLCQDTPNSTASGNGKLTLKKLYIRYGSSDKNLLSPYQFTYNSQNPAYNYGAKDRWGYRKAIAPGMNNFEFPYSSQQGGYSTNQDPVAAWNLTSIKLPSGGQMNIEYESDDYAYVQDKRAMEMIMLKGFGSSVSYNPVNVLYEGNSKQYNYLYFERGADGLGATPSPADLKAKYLQDEKYLYYAASVDIRGGAYEQIRGFAELESKAADDGGPADEGIGACPGNTNYCYLRLKKVSASDINFNPVALYAMNFSKYNLNHILYPGYGDSDPVSVLNSFGSALDEIRHMTRYHRTYVERGYCKSVNLDKSFIRLQCPDYIKKGGGVRVKRLTLNDQWHEMTNSSTQETATYGKDYDYTLDDPFLGKISSGVASYEPLAGGDENPLRSPIPYTAAGNLALPAIKFYQLEPLGENFYPPAQVGYSSVRVRSIHLDEGKSSMSEEESLFYTARDFPVRVEFSQKSTHSYARRSLLESKTMEQAAQGYTVFLNDMHGKPKAQNSYVVKRFENGVVKEREPVSGISYTYKTDGKGRLSSTVPALVKSTLGGSETYLVKSVELGKETDLTFDSRQNYDNTESIGADINLNVMMVGPIPVPIPIVFPSYNQETAVFHSMVATKMVQQYGIVSHVVATDHGAVTTLENLVYDGESGNVLLSRTSNEFNDKEYQQKLPAFYAYEGMGPAYTNIGFKDNNGRLYVNKLRDGFLETANSAMYTAGDELLIQGPATDKLWVLEKKVVNLADYYGFSGSLDKGYIAFFRSGYGAVPEITFTPGIVPPGISSTYHAPLTYGNDPLDLTFNSDNLAELPAVWTGTPYTFNIAFLWVGTTGTHTAQNIGYPAPLQVMLHPGELIVYNLYITECPEDKDDPIDAGGGGGEGGGGEGGGGEGGGGEEGGGEEGGGEGGGVPWDPAIDRCVNNEVIENHNCLLRVRPRYGLKTNGSTVQNWWWQPAAEHFVTGFTTEIVRSGRRNVLGATVQESSSLPPAAPQYSENTTLDQFMIKAGLISIVAQTFTDEAKPFVSFARELRPNPTGDASVYQELNDFVTGIRGTYRPLSTYTPVVARTYNAAGTPHSRKDGTFALANLYWSQNARIPSCGSGQQYLSHDPSNPALYKPWQSSGQVTKYNMFGNSVEEKDANGIYTAAQYGFNQKLPVAIASNARQENMFFESFEDYNSIVVPEATRRLFYNYTGAAPAYLQTPVGPLLIGFGSVMNPAAAYGKSYYKGSSTGSASVSIAASAHTGSRCLQTSQSGSLTIPVNTAYKDNEVGAFSFQKSGKYLINCWVQTSSGSPASASALTLTVGSTTFPFVLKTTPIEGWQLMEAVVDLAPLTGSPTSASLGFTGSLRIDDLRMLPYDANMKSFVYDFNTNRLMAQLDENHYASFYEYDQEGQLVRVKKETEKGIVTVSETRRAVKKAF